VATAFREGRITLLAAEAILRGAPRDVARLFLAMVARLGLEGHLDHAIRTWLGLAEPGREVFERFLSGDRKTAT
jgi:hypothetical protein